MRSISIPGVLAVLTALACSARAAQFSTERFTSGANGWQGSVEFLTGSWSFTGGVARAKFPSTGEFPVPDSVTLSNLPTASSGAFTGNYVAAGIGIVGFRFLAPGDFPASSNVILEFGGSTSVFERLFKVAQPGVWHSFSASLASLPLGGWTVRDGSAADFDAALHSVKYFAIRFGRVGVSNIEYVVDDIFLDAEPYAVNMESAGADIAITWNSLRTDLTYRVQSASDPGGSWTNSAMLMPTGRQHTITGPAATNGAPVLLRLN